MNQHPDHPLVTRYLAELDALLVGVDPVVRAETVLGVREHLDALVADTGRTDDDVRAALAEVGPAAAVADEAHDGRPPAGAAVRTAPPVVAPVARPAVARGWLPLTAALLQVLALLGLLLVFAVTPTTSTTASAGSSVAVVAREGKAVTRDATPVEALPSTSTTEFEPGALVAGAAGGLSVSMPFWLVVAVLVLVSGWWTGREKAALLALVPVAAVVLTAVPLLAYAALGVDAVPVGGFAALAMVAVGSGVALVALTRRAVARGRTPVPA